MKSNKEKLKEFMIWKSDALSEILLQCNPYVPIKLYSIKDLSDYDNNWTEEMAKNTLYTLYDNLLLLSDYQDYFGLGDTCPECVVYQNAANGCVNNCRYGKNNGFCIPYSSMDDNRILNNRYYEITKQLVRNQISYNALFPKQGVLGILEKLIKD